MKNQFALMGTRRFMPLFVAQFLAAFNDNFFKTMLAVMIAYGLIDTGGAQPEMMVTLAALVFVLPFALLTPLGGVLADKYDKARVIRVLKFAEVAIVLCGIGAFAVGSLAAMMVVLFALGVQSALMSPSKFSILPQHLEEDELIGGNAILNTGTYLAILSGTIFGALLAVDEAGQEAGMVILLVCALAGFFISRLIPKARAGAPDIRISYNTIGEAWRAVQFARAQKKGLFAAIIGGGWFFFVGGLYLAQMPNYASQIVHVDNHALTFFMVLFSVGVGIGGLLNNRLLGGKIEATFVPAAAAGMGLFSLDLFFASPVYAGEGLRTLAVFLSDVQGWRITGDLLGIAVCGGLYAVPLKTIVQARAPKARLARVVAAGALIEALCVLLSAAAALAVFGAGYDVADLFLMVAVLSFAPMVYIKKLVPKHRRGKARNG